MIYGNQNNKNSIISNYYMQCTMYMYMHVPAAKLITKSDMVSL